MHGVLGGYQYPMGKSKTHEPFKCGKRAEDQLFSQDTHSLLSLWGKPGRESIRMLCQ
jgi:hypothetical protein